MFSITETVQHHFSLQDLKNNTTNFIRSHSGHTTIKRPKHYIKCMRLICDLIKTNRHEVLGSECVPYKVITNGYGEFIRVENELFSVDAAVIFERLAKYEN